MDLIALLDELQTIARNGLQYAESPFDRERYERLLALAVREYAAATGLDDDEVRRRFAAEVGHITPKVGADAAIFDADERILLVLRADDHRWGLVAGWVEPGEAPAETVVREAGEEVGLDVRVDALVDVVVRRAGAGHGPHTVLSVLYLCSVVGGALRLQEHEVLDARHWPVDEVPAWHRNHEELARRALRAHRERRRADG